MLNQIVYISTWIFLFIILQVIYYVTCCFLQENDNRQFHFFIFWFNFLFYLLGSLCYFDLLFSNPGVVHKSLKDEENEKNLQNKSSKLIKFRGVLRKLIYNKQKLWFNKPKSIKLDKQHIKYESYQLQDLKQELENSYVSQILEYSYCFKCQMVKPPRAHHCSRCNVCYYRLDHHCYYIGKCVAQQNHIEFIRFLFYINTSLGGILIHVLLFYFFNSNIKQFEFKFMTEILIAIGIIVLYAFVFSLVILINTLRNLFRNITAIEDKNLYFEYKNPFRQNITLTLQQLEEEKSLKIFVPNILRRINELIKFNNADIIQFKTRQKLLFNVQQFLQEEQ